MKMNHHHSSFDNSVNIDHGSQAEANIEDSHGTLMMIGLRVVQQILQMRVHILIHRYLLI